MTIAEIKKWAKDKGYSIIKDKGEPTQYYWAKIDDPNVTGVAPSVSKVAKAVFNHMTNNAWLDHQNEYQENKTFETLTEN